jgi:hypothetical protein
MFKVNLSKKVFLNGEVAWTDEDAWFDDELAFTRWILNEATYLITTEQMVIYKVEKA